MIAKRSDSTRNSTTEAKSRRSRRAARSHDHIAVIRREERLVDEVQAAQGRLRVLGRRAMGVTGEAVAPSSLRGTIASSGAGMYPLLALAGLAAVLGFQRYGLSVLGPQVEDGMGASGTAIGLITALQTLAIGLVALPLAAVASGRRHTLIVVAGFAFALSTLFAGFVTGVWGLLATILVGAAALASVQALHFPLLIDSYPPEVRVRAFALYHGGLAAGGILAPLLVVLTFSAALTWRATFVIMAVAALAAAAGSLRLRDPGVGRHDVARVAAEVDRDTGRAREERPEDAALGFFETLRRVMLIPSMRWLLLGHVMLGMMTFPVVTNLFSLLEEHWRLTQGGRAFFFIGMAAFGAIGLGLFARRGEAALRESPGKLLRIGGIGLAVAGVAQGAAPFLPWLWGWVLLYGLSFGLLAVVHPVLSVTMLSIVPPRMRPHASALAGVSLVTLGTLAGLSNMQGFGGRFGVDIGLASLALPGLQVGIALIREGVKRVSSDLDRTVDELIESQYVCFLAASGNRLPMLACRHIDFSYGQVQVLFEVDFTVDDGEVVALLGTNGAGKSTLLRVISGLGVPSAGSVRFRGEDVTFLDAERRLRLGITQVPGGRAVFGPLSVVENLRVFGYSHGRNRRAVEEGIEASLTAFPALAERRTQLAATLSGGEQQMLGLSKALILKPKLLLIDELSLGLAPKIVSELLSMVRWINAAGTAVVLVEQSVNVALLLVEHVYFMEKGEIRFDGKAQELLARADLLRSVFLEGAARGLQAQGIEAR